MMRKKAKTAAEIASDEAYAEAKRAYVAQLGLTEEVYDALSSADRCFVQMRGAILTYERATGGVSSAAPLPAASIEAPVAAIKAKIKRKRSQRKRCTAKPNGVRCRRLRPKYEDRCPRCEEAEWDRLERLRARHGWDSAMIARYRDEAKRLYGTGFRSIEELEAA